MIYSNSNIAFLSDGTNTSFHNGNGESMRITSGGNVLIGTTTDSGYKLDVNGEIRANTSLYLGLTFGTTVFNAYRIWTDPSSEDFIITNQFANAEILRSNYLTRNVLIGTTTDVGAKLYVDGAFRTGTLTAGTQTAAVDWRLGNARGGTATANALIRVQINGVLVDLIGNYA